MNRVLALRVLVALSLAFVSSCSRDEGPATTEGTDPPAATAKSLTTTTLAERVAERDAVVRGYFEAFATADPEKMSAMVDFAEPGSIAHLYAIHQTATTRAFRDAGGPMLPDRITFRGDEVEKCSVESETCGIGANFTTDPDSGLLTGFTVDGQSLEGRLLGGSGQATSGADAQFTLVSAYKSIQANSLYVVVDVENGPNPLDISPWSAEYVTPDGRQVTASDGVGPAELRPGAKATYLVIFDGADLGGTLYMGGYSERGQSEFEVELPLK